MCERAIAAEVFGVSNYDPSIDSYVRVKASDVRKRLARYYENPDPLDTLRIELPIGSYLPHFSPLEKSGPAEEAGAATLPEIQPAAEASRAEPDHPFHRRGLWIGAAGLCLAALVAWLALQPRPHTAIQKFWSPFLESRRDLLISLPSPPSWALAGSTSVDYTSGRLKPVEELAPNLRRFQIPNANLVEQRIYLGIGETIGLAKLAIFLDRSKRPFLMKAVMDVSSSDLSMHNVILVGGFSSRWTVRIAQDLPYRLEYRTEGPRVLEMKGKRRSWVSTGWQPGGRDGTDYAIVARLGDWTNGQALMILAGPQTFGSQAAMEYTVNPEAIEELARRGPPGWESKNVEAVIETRVIEGSPSPGRIVAADFW